MPRRITIKQLHATTGEHVRRAAASRDGVVITDRGQPVALLANPAMVKRTRRKRALLPEYTALMAKKPRGDVLADLAAIRGDR
jgi:antitoxin (DNA-binding transcriptional repressor) of toxin-antitoxin stability system